MQLNKGFSAQQKHKKKIHKIFSLINPSHIVCSVVCKITYVLRYVPFENNHVRCIIYSSRKQQRMKNSKAFIGSYGFIYWQCFQFLFSTLSERAVSSENVWFSKFSRFLVLYKYFIKKKIFFGQFNLFGK